ncbi:PREDICTED: C-type natriuretic peptide [Thamnophis sirtalis]|uniref:C-type natriuretic peptide n=1 Tax=Thamnophis sirtalis TaxID=35019 RepID=A0A6I9YPQ4_9SAUR|nr:PREDICTED: C-type natriuretic peptide [Thamnophis sirtalis]
MSGQAPCSASLLLLLLLLGQGGAKPLGEIQSLSSLFEEDLEPPMGAEEMDQGREESLMAGALDQPDVVFPWARSLEEHPVDFQQLLRELLSSARRHQSRSKKGSSRGCFGAKLDRIGAFSGMGC